MLIHQKDWLDYPLALPDTQTTNRSWVHLAALYKSMGVKNYYFHLALMNPQLQGVDPHAPDLTYDQKLMIATEVTVNPWYFFREVVRLPKDGGGISKFEANRGIISLIWSFLCNIDYGLVMPRQTGKSVGADCLKIWLLLFHYNGAEMFLLTKDSNLRAKNIKKIKDIIKLLPKWLNPTGKQDADNTEIITCVVKNNKLWTAVGQMQEDQARKTGRGYSLIFTQTDETAFIPNVHIAMPAMLAAGSKARTSARESGLVYGNLFTTTAGKKDTTEGEFVYNLIMDGMYWNEKLLDCYDKEQTQEMVRLHSSGTGSNINGTFSHRQLGFTDDWLRAMIAESRQNEDDANRDFLNKWTSGTESNPLSTQLLEVIAMSEVEPAYIHVTPELYNIQWYISYEIIERRMKEGWYVIGLDSSNAVGRDANALLIVDIRDMSVVASCRISEANLHKYALWLANFMIRYERTTLIIENKSSAQSILDTVATMLIKFGINPFKRIYNSVVDNHTAREIDYKLISSKMGLMESTYLSLKGQFGFQTTGSRRSFLYDTVLQEAANSTGHLLKDRNLSAELRGLVLKNGRVDHLSGSHDDSVIAWLMTHWFVKHSKNLSFYGIEPGMCLSLVADGGALLSPEKLEERRKLAVINIEIAELKEKLVSAPDIIETKKFEKMLAWKVTEARALGETTYSIDSILEDVRKNKVNKKSLRESLHNAQARRNFRQVA